MHQPGGAGRRRGEGRPDLPSAPFAPRDAHRRPGSPLLEDHPAHASTTWITEPGAYRAQCSSAGGANVLQITALDGAQTATPSPDPTWGLHLLDANIALGNLISVVHSEANAYARAPLGAAGAGGPAGGPARAVTRRERRRAPRSHQRAACMAVHFCTVTAVAADHGPAAHVPEQQGHRLRRPVPPTRARRSTCRPRPALPAALQGLRFARRPMTFALAAQRRFGDVWQLRVPTRSEAFVVTCHPDHLRSLLKADPADAPSLTGESPLRPILGPNSVLTSVGARHMRQRKLLLPPFHGEAVQRYVEMIADVARQEIDHWPVGEPFALAPRMQAVTLEVIMRGVFGVGVASDTTAAERRMRQALRRMLAASMSPLYFLVELRNARHLEPKGVLAAVMAMVDRQMYAVIRERRAAADRDRRRRRALAAARRARRGGRAAHRPRAARRAHVAGARRPRDDRQLAGLDVRAPAAHAGRLRPAARAGPFRRPRRRPRSTSRPPSTRGCATAR